MFIGCVLVLLGVLSASDLVKKLKPELTSRLTELAMYRSALGLLAVAAGFYLVVCVVSCHDTILSTITSILAATALIANGSLASSFIVDFLMKVSGLKDRAGVSDVYTWLVSRQEVVGLIAVAVGVWCMLARLLGIW